MNDESKTKMNIQIPVVDISDTNAEDRIAADLVNAAIVHGFVYIRNRGIDIPIDSVDEAFALSRRFFASPSDEKQMCTITENNKGWVPMHSETLDSKTQRIGDFKEAFNLCEFSNGKAQQPLPPSMATQEAFLSAFADHCHALCLKILTLFAIGLHVDPAQGGSTWFSSRHSRTLGPSGCTLRLLYYPSIPEDADYQPDIDIRAGAHSDYGSITLLFQRPGQPGLEILTAQGVWEPVYVVPPGTENDPSPPILVNIGDLLSYWTNGLFRSTVHRVTFPKGAKRGGEDRYSIAFFCHPVDNTILEPVPSMMTKARVVDGYGNTDKWENMTAAEHLQERLRATYLSLKWDKDRLNVEASSAEKAESS